MQFIRSDISEVIIVEPQLFQDSRGFFMETYQAREFVDAGIDYNFVQENHSGSAQGVLRGLHYQIRQPQGKLVRALTGEIYDVAVDLRRSSSTFGRWVGMTLLADSKHQLWIPPGFAHGFIVLSEWADVLYKTTDYYAPQWERTLLWNDPALGIDWPLLNDQPPLLSPKDAQGKPLAQAEVFE